MSKQGKILVADDERTFRLTTVELLRREGYDCDSAVDSVTAAQMILEGEYDLLIADIKMPGNMDLELVRRLPSFDETMPVILVTGYPSLASAVDSVSLRVSAYMLKPLKIEDLLMHVRQAVLIHRTYSICRQLRHRLEDWQTDVCGIEDALKQGNYLGSAGAVTTFAELMAANITLALQDLKLVTCAALGGNIKIGPCHLFNCPNLRRLRTVIEETTQSLKKTKSAFRSEEIRAVRGKLEQALHPIWQIEDNR